VSFADIPADTDMERVIKALDQLSARLDRFAEAINGLGQNQQWIIDQAQGIFQMLSSPQFLAAIPAMMSAVPAEQEADSNG